MKKVCVRVVVAGRVQGVFFRVTARDAARSLGITGWVKNREDRKVELLLEGEEKAVDKMVSWCREGPSGAVVTNVMITREPYLGAFNTFKVSY